MRRRDSAAEALHGRLVCRPFKDPATGSTRTFWGRVQYRGKQYRPQYFTVVYEDGDSHTATTAALRKWLMPAEQQLPAGITIPDRDSDDTAAAGSVQHLQQQWQQPAALPLPSMLLPAGELQPLLQQLDFSRCMAAADPVCCSHQLHACWTQAGGAFLPLNPGMPAPLLVMAPATHALTAALAAAFALQPAFVACYIAGFNLPPELDPLVRQLQQQQRAAVIVGQQGQWLCCTFGAFCISNWRLH